MNKAPKLTGRAFADGRHGLFVGRSDWQWGTILFTLSPSPWLLVTGIDKSASPFATFEDAMLAAQSRFDAFWQTIWTEAEREFPEHLG